MIAAAAKLRRVDDGEEGWALAMLNDTRGQGAVLRALDTLICSRRVEPRLSGATECAH
jgi:hypothetical protein